MTERWGVGAPTLSRGEGDDERRGGRGETMGQVKWGRWQSAPPRAIHDTSPLRAPWRPSPIGYSMGRSVLPVQKEAYSLPNRDSRAWTTVRRGWGGPPSIR